MVYVLENLSLCSRVNGMQMTRFKQLVPGLVLWVTLLLGTLLLTLVPMDIVSDSQFEAKLVIFAVTWMPLAVWAALGSGSNSLRVVNCLLAVTVVCALVQIFGGTLFGIEFVPGLFLAIGLWFAPVWVFASLRFTGLIWRIESPTSPTNPKLGKGQRLIGWLLTLASAVVVWQILSRILPGAVFDLTVGHSLGTAQELPNRMSYRGFIHEPGFVGQLIFLFLYLPMVVQLLFRLRGWIVRRRLCVLVQILLIIILPPLTTWIWRAQPMFEITFTLAIITAATLFATNISLGKIGEWLLARKRYWPLLALLTLLMWWAMIPGLLLRMCGYRLVGRRTEREEPREQDGRLTSSWRGGLVSFTMLTLLLVTSVYAVLCRTGMMRQHELALIGFNEETGYCEHKYNSRFRGYYQFLTDDDFMVLQHCPNLERLVIRNNSYVTGSFLESLQAQTQLESLELVNCQRFTPANLDQVRQFKQLKDLNLTSTLGLDIAVTDLSFVRSLKNLGWITLVGYPLTGKSLLEPLGELPQLIMVNLSESGVADQQLKPLAQAESLSLLYLNETEVGDAGLAHLEGLKNLKVIELDNTRVTDRGLVTLAGLSELRRLSLNLTGITGPGLVHLEHLQKLNSISLVYTEVTGAGLIHLAGLKQVGSIYLSGTPFSDADLVHLRDLKELESLGQLPVFDDQFTPAGLCRLVMYLPEYKEYFPFLRKVFLRTGEFTTSSSPFDNETLTASRAAVYLKENVSPDELSADDRLQMATLLLAGEYGVELEYDSDGRVVGVTFSGIPLSSDHLQLLSMLPQLSSVSMNYSREDDSLVETSDLSEPGMDLTGLDLPGMPVLPGEGKSEEVTAFQQSDLARLARISGLKDLHLDGDLFTDDVIEQIVKIKGLHSLHLSTSQITGASLRQLEQLSDLREISFFGCEELTDESLLAIAAMPKIRSVSIGDCKRTSSKGLAGILALPVLETLALYDSAENLDEQALEKLSTSHLKSVILVGELDDSICTRLATISSLEEIAIVSTVFRGEQLEQLKSLARLVNLKLEGCTSLSVEGLRQINQLTGLRKLFLNHSEVSDEEVLQLTDLKQLEFLDLRVNQSLTDTGLAALAAMPKLQELSLFYCPGIRGEGLDHLAMLSELRILDIGNNKIRDVGLQRLSNNRSIWELKLSLNQEFTDAGAIYLGRMKQLKKLELGFTTQLSLDLILKLDAALPGCEITPSQR